MGNIEGSLVEFGKVAQLLCLEGPIEAVTSSDYANRPPLNYHRCAGTKSKCNTHRSEEKIKRAVCHFVSICCISMCIGMRNECTELYRAMSNGILHNFCLTRKSTLTSQDYSPSSVVYIPEPVRAIWRYLPSI